MSDIEFRKVVESEIRNAVNDAFEEAASLVENRGNQIGGAIDPKITAREIRRLQTT